MQTTKDIEYKVAGFGLIAVIPAGTRVMPAGNLPMQPGKYWVDEWPGMSEQQRSWHRNYGFLVSGAQVGRDALVIHSHNVGADAVSKLYGHPINVADAWRVGDQFVFQMHEGDYEGDEEFSVCSITKFLSNEDDEADHPRFITYESAVEYASNVSNI
jgi:hypothetical protein